VSRRTPLTVIRSERVASIVLLAAAALGLILANSPLAEAVLAAKSYHPAPLGALDFSLAHWVSDGLLVVFFFVVAVELKHELVHGELNSPRRALRPAIAALGGILVPAGIYLAMTWDSGYLGGWPIPTATDIAFALGVLAVFGKGIPSAIRVFLLALAIIDDLVAIIIIALFFTKDPQLLPLGVAVFGLIGFALLSRLLGTRVRVPVAIFMAAIAVGVWYLVAVSGVHATIAGVALGLAMALRPGQKVRHALEPFSNGVVLPLFAFSAALVAIPSVSITELAAPFYAIVIALPVGKIIGITAFTLLATRLGPRSSRPAAPLSSIVMVGALGGVGFTVALLMNELAFASSEEVLAEGTLAVLLGSAIAIVLSSVLVARESRRYRRVAEAKAA
jgi:NhaA family Na+:H+ antiporter